MERAASDAGRPSNPTRSGAARTLAVTKAGWRDRDRARGTVYDLAGDTAGRYLAFGG